MRLFLWLWLWVGLGLGCRPLNEPVSRLPTPDRADLASQSRAELDRRGIAYTADAFLDSAGWGNTVSLAAVDVGAVDVLGRALGRAVVTQVGRLCAKSRHLTERFAPIKGRLVQGSLDLWAVQWRVLGGFTHSFT